MSSLDWFFPASVLTPEEFDRRDAQQNPDDCRDHGDTRKHVAGLGTKGTLPPHASQRSGQPSSTAPLNEH